MRSNEPVIVEKMVVVGMPAAMASASSEGEYVLVEQEEIESEGMGAYGRVLCCLMATASPSARTGTSCSGLLLSEVKYRNRFSVCSRCQKPSDCCCG